MTRALARTRLSVAVLTVRRSMCSPECWLHVAGDWDAVRDYKVTGSNSYSKMVERYRQDLLAVRKAQAAAAAQ